MPINLSTTEYTNNSLKNTNSGMYVSGGNSGGSLRVSVNASAFKTGETISGEVVSIDGKNITLKLSDGQNVNARLDGNTNLALGKILSFEVNSSEDGKSILLRPLYSNLNGNSTVTAALKAAYMPLTESNISMTQTMIEEGMSISRDALNDMSRIVNSVPNANPSTIVVMDKMGLPINEITVNQFENYKNFEHQIMNDVQDMSEGITSAIAELASESAAPALGSIGEYISLIDSSLVYTENELIDETVNFAENAGISESMESLAEGNGLNPQAREIDGNHAGQNISNTDNAEVKNFDGIRGNIQDSKAISDNTQGNSVASQELSESAPKSGLSFLSSITDKIKNLLPPATQNEGKSESLPGRERFNTINLLNEAGEYTGKTLPYSASNSEIIDLLKETVDFAQKLQQSGGDTAEFFAKISDLFKDKGVNNIISDALKDQLTISPQKIAKEGEVDELYNRILKISQKVTDITEASNLSNGGKILESAQNLNNNVSFMNDINQFVNYVQLPLKMYQENAHGELYVYSNKKNLKNSDGNLTALLHLDMEHLGPMDVYVAMKNHVNVTTNFRLASEELLDFIGKNIHLLDERLTTKGYNMSSSVTMADKMVGKDVPIADEFMKNSPAEEGFKNMTYVQFDVRA